MHSIAACAGCRAQRDGGGRERGGRRARTSAQRKRHSAPRGAAPETAQAPGRGCRRPAEAYPGVQAAPSEDVA